MLSLWSIFWRTFAQLALAALIAAQGVSWLSEDFAASATVTGLALLAAFIGAVVAVLISFAKSPAVTAVEKAMRSAAEKLAGILSVLVINEATDWVSFERLIWPSLVAIGLAFAVTYFQYQGSTTAESRVLP